MSCTVPSGEIFRGKAFDSVRLSSTLMLEVFAGLFLTYDISACPNMHTFIFVFLCVTLTLFDVHTCMFVPG